MKMCIRDRPEEWHNDIVSVSFSVKDTADTGNFEIAKIEAKVGQNGSWTDVTLSLIHI